MVQRLTRPPITVAVPWRFPMAECLKVKASVGFLPEITILFHSDLGITMKNIPGIYNSEQLESFWYPDGILWVKHCPKADMLKANRDKKFTKNPTKRKVDKVIVNIGFRREGLEENAIADNVSSYVSYGKLQ